MRAPRACARCRASIKAEGGGWSAPHGLDEVERADTIVIPGWRGAQGAGFDGAHRMGIPGHAQLGAVQREELDGAAEFEGAQAVVGEDGDVVGHGAMLPVSVAPTPALPARRLPH